MLYFIWSNIQISANLKQSQISRSRNLANLSTSYLDENDRMMAVKLALEALPDENNSRPVIHEAAYALSKAEGAYNYPDTLDIEEVAQLPARYKLNAFKVSLDGRYLAMMDGYYLIRFFDLETMEEIGQAELAKAASLLWMTETDVLFVSCGDLLSAFNIRTGELLWKETYENNILAMCAAEAGLDVKVSEIHGMSQRGGSVSTIIRVGEKVDSMVCDPGCADVVVAFEAVEALRAQQYLAEGGRMFVNDEQIVPVSVHIGAFDMPADAAERLDAMGAVRIPAGQIAREAGSPRSTNVVLVGALSTALPFTAEQWRDAIARRVPPKTVEANLEAFERGRAAAEA